MAEIDINKKAITIYNMMINKNDNKIIKHITSLLTAIQISAALHCSDAFSRTSLLFTGITTASIGIQIRNKKIEKECFNEFKNEIKKTDKYKECIEEYNKFIHNLANLIKYLNLSNTKEIIIFYEYLLQAGLLSKKSEETKTINHEYHNFEYEKNPMEELTGARVAGGKTVCRHQSAMLINLLNELGIKACNISAHTATLEEAKRLMRKKSKKLNHSMVGIIEGDNKYIFDCTVDSFVSIDKEKNNLAKRFEYEKNYYYYLPKEFKNFNINTLEIRMSFEKIKKSELNKEELVKLREKIQKIIEDQHKIIASFYLANERIINRISELENELCPHSDEPINEWILKL